MQIGIIGLPNVGKSTLFQAITQKKVDISNYPFCTIAPNIGVAQVPDERLEKLAEIIGPEKVVPAAIEFVDIAGLVKNAHKGEGLGNQFLSHVYGVDALVLVLRCFTDEKIAHTENKINPSRDYQIIVDELRLKDEKLARKPMLVICNKKSEGENLGFEKCDILMDVKLELEASEMDKKELDELGIEQKLGELIELSYKTLGLITFYTIKGGRELRASSLKKGETVLSAAEKIHSDFREKFIRAEVVGYDDFIKAGSWLRARETGVLRVEGRDYLVRDGDIIEFKI
jgi:hypothetical protein